MTQTFNPRHYRNGGTAQIGDVIRSLENKPSGPRVVGDVFTVSKLSSWNGNPYYLPNTHGAPDTFELIARAGEPVKFLPGDVVEFIAKNAELDGSYGYSRRVGDRYTVIERYNDFAASTSVFTIRDGQKTWAPKSYFKLVRRPEPAKEPLTFTPPAEPRFRVGDTVFREGWTHDYEITRIEGDRLWVKTYNARDSLSWYPFEGTTLIRRPSAEPVQTWRGHREGDTVRVEFQGVLTSIRSSSVVFGEPGSTEAIRVGVDASVFTAEVERPLAVGDLIENVNEPGIAHKVMAVGKERICVKHYITLEPVLVDRKDWRRVS